MLHVSNATVATVMGRFGLADADVRAWLAQVVFEGTISSMNCVNEAESFGSRSEVACDVRL